MVKKIIILLFFINFHFFLFSQEFGYLNVETEGNLSGFIKINNSVIGKTGEVIKYKTGKYQILFENSDFISSKEVIIEENRKTEIKNLKTVKKSVLNAEFDKYCDANIKNPSADRIFNDYEDYKRSNITAKKETALAVMHLIGNIIPVTNLLGLTYYDNRLIFGAPLFIQIPVPVVSFSFLTASIVLFSVHGFKFFYDQNNDLYRGFFIGSVVCCSVSYIINFVISVFCFVIGFDLYNHKDGIIERDLKNKILEKFIIDFNNNKLSLLYNIKI